MTQKLQTFNAIEIETAWQLFKADCQYHGEILPAELRKVEKVVNSEVCITVKDGKFSASTGVIVAAYVGTPMRALLELCIELGEQPPTSLIGINAKYHPEVYS